MTLNPIYMDYVNKLKTASTQLQEHASHGHQHGDWNEFNRLKNSLVMSYGQETFVSAQQRTEWRAPRGHHAMISLSRATIALQ